MLLFRDLIYYRTQPSDYGDVFLQHESNFYQYEHYCRNFPTASQKLQDLIDNDTDIITFMLQCQQSLNHALPLQALLIKPVQRVLKYHLLLANITKKLTPDFTGYTNLCKAHATMMSVAAGINETQRVYEASIRVQEIQSCLMGWKDYLKVIGFKGLRYVIVFEKLLLLLKRDKKESRYYYKGHIDGEEVSVMAAPIRNHPFCFKVFSITNRDYYFLLETKNEDDKMKWMDTLVMLIETDLCLSPEEIWMKTSALPRNAELISHSGKQDYYSNRKRPRSYREDEPVISEPRQILSDQSNVNEDIGPRPVVFSRHHASRRKISVKRSKESDDMETQPGSTNTNISDIIRDETPSHPKLLGYSTVADENTEMIHLVEPPDDGPLQWSKLAAHDSHIGDSGEDGKMGRGDLRNLSILAQIEEDKIMDFVSDETAGKIPKGILPYRESVISISSLESVNLEGEDSDATSVASSKRSSLVSLGDIQICTEPPMTPIPEDECDGDAEDHVMQEDHMIHDDITENNHQLPLTTTGTDEPGLHDDDKIIQPTSSDDVTDGGKPEEGDLEAAAVIKTEVHTTSSDTDSEEEHDIDPAIHSSPMYSGLIDKDNSQQPGATNEDMFITASGRFIAPSSTLPRMRRSMSVTRSITYSLSGSAPGILGAAARKRFRLLSRQSEEGQSKDYTQSDDDDEDEDYVVVSDHEDQLVTTSLPLRRSQSMRVSSKNQSIKRSGRRAAFKRHSNTDPVDDGGQPGLLQPAVADGSNDQFLVKNLAPVFDQIKSDSGTVPIFSSVLPETDTPSSPQDAQFNCSVDTTNISTSITTDSQQQSTKLTEPFQFTATTDSTTTPNTTEHSKSPPPSSENDNTIFSTPANQEIPIIQTFSQSPYVVGKTPLPTKVMSPSPLFATPVETGTTGGDTSPVFVTPVGDTSDAVVKTQSKDEQVTTDYGYTEDDKNGDVKLPSEIAEGDDNKEDRPIPSLITPANDDVTSSSSHANLSDSHGSSLEPFSPLVTSLAKSPILQQVVDRDKAAFPITPDPVNQNLSQDQVLLNVANKLSATKSPNELQVSGGGGKQSRRRRSNEPYSPSGKHLHSPDATQRVDDPISPAVTPSSQLSRSLGDVNPKLKSISVPSSPATDVSFELPSENIVLKGRVSSLSLGGNDGSSVDYIEDGDDDFIDDNVTEKTQLISPASATLSQSQSKLSRRKQKHHKARPRSQKALEESQPLLSDEEDEQTYGTVQETSNPSPTSSTASSWSVRSFFGFLVSLGSGLGNLLWFYITGFFRGRGNQDNRSIN
ncbi:uncharacterized protein [Dysidea avara]|uniref:uncharacterized protein isoform X2 n=1 Tax=Dysidea avara TaxID=196820 RepID=UPI00331BAD53